MLLALSVLAGCQVESNDDSGNEPAAKISYTVKFDKNGGEGKLPADITATVGEEFTLPATELTKTGYDFKGWCATANGTGTTYEAGSKVKDLSTENGATVTLYAKWIKEGDYIITYKNVENAENDNPASYNVETETITLNAAAKSGYIFDGWYKEDSFATKVTEIAKGSSGNITLYAKWNLETYTITYELNGGTNADGNPESYNVETETITLKEAAKNGYSFGGWYREDSFATKATEIAKGSTGNITLYAKWLEIYTITFDANGGKGEMNPQNAAAETEFELLKNTFTKNGYIFAGWATSADGNVSYSEKAKITATGNITLYAKWIITANTVVDAISALSGEGPHDIAVAGEITSGTISAISDALKNNAEAKVNLDLSRTTGLAVIDSYAFKDCSSLVSVSIPGSVTDIKNSAFANCVNLTTVNIPDGVSSIWYYVFKGCTSLASVNIPDSVTYVGYANFNGCTSLKFNEFDNAKYLGNENNPYFVLIEAKDTSITLCNINPDTKVIAGEAFKNCTSLTSVAIPDGVISISCYIFEECTSLTTVSIPNSVTSISKYVFKDCSSLTTVNIPNNITYINDSMFYNCASLISVIIPDSVTSIGYGAFEGCSKLAIMTIPDGVTSIGSCAFQDCNALTSVVIPDSVTAIGDFAFSGCSNLKFNEYDNVNYLGNENNPYLVLIKAKDENITSCNINTATKMILDNAFFGCSKLTSVTIPASVISIGQVAFNYLDELTTVNYRGTKEQWNAIKFGYYNDSLTASTTTVNYNYTGE